MPLPPLLLKVIIFADLVYLTVVGAAIAAYFVYNALFAHYPQLMYCIVDISVLILPLNVLVLFKGYQQLQVANQLQLQVCNYSSISYSNNNHSNNRDRLWPTLDRQQR